MAQTVVNYVRSNAVQEEISEALTPLVGKKKAQGADPGSKVSYRRGQLDQLPPHKRRRAAAVLIRQLR